MATTTSRKKTVLLRLVRGIGATVIAYGIGWLAGPDVADVVGKEYAVLLSAVLTPALIAAEKWVRYGKDPSQPDETPGPPGQ